LKRHKCWSPLQLAAREGYKDVVEFLIANGADIAALNGFEDGRQDTLLQIAASQGKPLVVRTLLDHNIVPTTSNGRFGGPLRAAAVSASRLYNEETSLNLVGGTLKDELFAIWKRYHRAAHREAKDELFAIVIRYHRTASDASLVRLQRARVQPCTSHHFVAAN
jgi:ankyrin repeat protein